MALDSRREYFSQSLEKLGFEVIRVRRSIEVRRICPRKLRDAMLVVQHGPGLFDGYNTELSEMESTSDLIASLLILFADFNLRPIIYFHSLLGRDNEEMFGRQDLLLNAPIPKVTAIQSAAHFFGLPWIDHGVQPIAVPETKERTESSLDNPAIGFFGFFQSGGKDFDGLLAAVQSVKARLVGSVATSDVHEVETLRQLLNQLSVPCDLGTGWTTDTELSARLFGSRFFLSSPERSHSLE